MEIRLDLRSAKLAENSSFQNGPPIMAHPWSKDQDPYDGAQGCAPGQGGSGARLPRAQLSRDERQPRIICTTLGPPARIFPSLPSPRQEHAPWLASKTHSALNTHEAACCCAAHSKRTRNPTPSPRQTWGTNAAFSTRLMPSGKASLFH